MGGGYSCPVYNEGKCFETQAAADDHYNNGSMFAWKGEARNYKDLAANVPVIHPTTKKAAQLYENIFQNKWNSTWIHPNVINVDDSIGTLIKY